MRSQLGAWGIALVVVLAASCDPEPTPGTPPARAVSMDYEAADLFAAPFPGEHLRRDGAIDVSRFPNPLRTDIVDQIHRALEDVDGFGTSSPVHFRLNGPIDGSALPDASDSTDPGTAIALVDVDPASPEQGMLHRFDTYFAEDGGPNGDAYLLTLMPVQGLPLRPNTLYAAVVTDQLRSEEGEPLVRAPAMQALIDGEAPAGMEPDALAAFRAALAGLGDTIPIERVVAMTAFRTGAPLAVLERAVAGLDGRYEARVSTAGFVAHEVFDDYCVFESVVEMPVFQEGEPPYLMEGGAWVLDGDGVPVLQRTEQARLVVTVPRATMPAAGFPTTVLVRTGAGGDRPLVERGLRDAEGVTIAPGAGPALELARAGLAGVSVDGPHGGLRNPDGGDEQFRVFNIQNPTALRDNLRQSAIELVLLARALDTLTLDASSCPGFVASDGTMRFDTARMALMGHSMGASIAPLAAAFEPRFGALVLSGAGGSWITNVMYKELPIATRPAAELLLRYTSQRRTLTIDDPVLGMLQWAGESADAALYARLLVEEPVVGGPRDVLMFQGIVDHYILPPIANPLSLALGVDRAGPGLDESIAEHTPISELLPLRGRGEIALSDASGNRDIDGAPVTVVLVQHGEDGVEDGHEVVFQVEAAKTQYRCFLQTFARGETPVVPDPAAPDPACE